MRSLVIGIVLGSVLSLGALATLTAFAIDGDFNSHEKYHPDGLIKEVNRLVNNVCDVTIGRGRPVQRDECFYNEVMVGMRDNTILCADVSVYCFSKSDLSE